MVGPTWRRYRSGGWYLPERTLGWGVINWMAAFLCQPGGPDAGKPFLPTLEQARFIAWWYAVDERGRFAYRAGILRRLKGWGKDPLVAALSLAELCGPVAFSHWDEDENPVGKPQHSAWIQIAAVSQDQTRTTFTLFPAMASQRLREEYGVELNKTIIYTKAGGMIEGVTSSPLALEGKRPTFVVLNETQWWAQSNDGHSMFNVVEGNVTKSAFGSSRYLAICNAHVPGQDSIGERLHDNYHAVVAGQAVDTGILYDALEAPADTPVSEIPHPEDDPDGYAEGIKALKAGLDVARGDARWLDLDTIVASILDVSNPVSESRRKFLNQVNAAEDSWIAPFEWDRLQADVALQPGERITLGFDGSKGSDHTALVACRVEDAALFPIKVWNPEQYGGEVPREDVDATVRWVFSRYKVAAFRADVKEFEAYVDAWSRSFGRKLAVKATPGNPVAFDMRGHKKAFALDCERFLDAVIEGGLTHDGNKLLRQHVLNARRHPTTYDAIAIRKASKDSSRKIDAAVCAVLAFGARQEFLMSKRGKSRKVVILR
ncbi:phage terminase large subunit-like protein [Amycolatopsis cihanbeyliensis]|uniref:Phage terminase large subunit-like protein n=2 Tax=Amycolatopsis cihanbeyliensis TaxID=1128664 RepID=A0A542DNZ5_AMYCI|nr:phage terminase large subunit-like protein [Amycolatopsis cihanbeyliensis]